MFTTSLLQFGGLLLGFSFSSLTRVWKRKEYGALNLTFSWCFQFLKMNSSSKLSKLNSIFIMLFHYLTMHLSCCFIYLCVLGLLVCLLNSVWLPRKEERREKIES